MNIFSSSRTIVILNKLTKTEKQISKSTNDDTQHYSTNDVQTCKFKSMNDILDEKDNGNSSAVTEKF